MVEEKDLKISNMRGIAMARKKPLNVVAALETEAASKTIDYEKPEKSACKMIDASDIDGLIDLLHNEAK